VLNAVTKVENLAAAVGDTPAVGGDRDLAGDDQRLRFEGVGMIAEAAVGFTLDGSDFGESFLPQLFGEGVDVNVFLPGC